MTPAELAPRTHLAARAGLHPDSVGAALLVERTRDVAVGDRLLVTVTPTPPGRDPHDGPAPAVEAVVEVDELVVMACGCSRAGFDRPGSADGPCPRVHVVSAGCRWASDEVALEAVRVGETSRGAR